MDADDIIKSLELEPHPEGGHFCETFRDPTCVDGRSVSTAIYYLLRDGEASDWHRVDATETWHFYAGAPLELKLSDDGRNARSFILGIDLMNAERPQIVVPKSAWQSARTLGAWTLVGCTVAPGFDFGGFEIAPADHDLRKKT